MNNPTAPYQLDPNPGFSPSAWLVALLVSLGVFALVPLLHLLSPPDRMPTIVNDGGYAERPPLVPIDPPKPSPKAKEREKPKIEKQLPKIPIELLGLSLSAIPSEWGGLYGDPSKLFDAEEEIGKILDLSEVDDSPRAIFQAKPNYPYVLKNQSVSGWVLLEWVIDERGRVTHLKAVQSSHREFEAAAMVSIQKSKWQPGAVAGKAVSTRLRQRIEFTP